MKRFLLITLFIASVISAQVEREVRAVWLTTNFRLDWPPPTLDEQRQMESLREIFRNLKEKNYNTVYFQIRSNGTMLYNSQIEPMTHYFTGRNGAGPSYDPCSLAVSLAREFGLEIHAWVNMIRIYSGAENRVLENRNHPYNSRREWVKSWTEEGKTQYWFNPAEPGLGAYFADLFSEIVTKYDFDGIHLDFFRYPGKSFNDDNEFRSSGSTLDKGSWRRENLTRILREINSRVKSIKPYIKVGSAPIGIKRNFGKVKGWEGYNDVYQDSEKWLEEGLLDYIVPQIYWQRGGRYPFDAIAAEWLKNKYGRHIVLGIAAYKDEVFPDIPGMIEFSRRAGSEGVAFFRYSNIKNTVIPAFAEKALPPPAKWMEIQKPTAPDLFYASIDYSGKGAGLFLKWDDYGSTGEPPYYISVYSPESEGSPLGSDNLLTIIPYTERERTLPLGNKRKIEYYLTLKGMNRLWEESSFTSETIKILDKKLNSLLEKGKEPGAYLVREKEGQFIVLRSDKNDSVRVIVSRKDQKDSTAAFSLFRGDNILKLPAGANSGIKIIFASGGKELNLRLK